jgi:hypothetical protein
MAALVVAAGLAPPAVFLADMSLGWAGLSIVGAAALMTGIGELFLRAARRILNAQYRPRQ